MSLHGQTDIHEFSAAGIEEWLLELDQFGVALSAAWRRIREALRPGGGIRDIEQALRRLLGQFGGVFLEIIRDELQDRDRLLPPLICPKCGRPMWVNRKEELTQQFREGKLKLLRNYDECRPCGVHGYPLDLDLGLNADGECAPQFSQDLCLMGMQLPAEACVELLAAVTGRKVSATLVREEVHRAGGALVALERQEAEALHPYDEKGSLRPNRHGPLPALHSAPPPEGTLIVEMDGVFANLGQEPDIREAIRLYHEAKLNAEKQGVLFLDERPTPFREVRQARFYRLDDRVIKPTKSGKKRSQILRSETVSVVNDPELFAMRVHAVAQAWQVDRYSAVCVLGDGGDFIWELARTALNAHHETLDSRHAKSHVYECAAALYGEASTEGKQWAARWCSSVHETGPGKLLEHLQELKLQSWSLNAARVLKNLVEYVTKHRHRMDYPKFRALGLPIGSGAIESANRQVVGDRCKRSGMGWSKSGLQAILSLRAAFLSSNWSIAFTAIDAHRSYASTWAKLSVPATAAVAPALNSTTPPKTTSSHTVANAGVPRPSRRPVSRSLVPERKRNGLLRSGVICQTSNGHLAPCAGVNP